MKTYTVKIDDAGTEQWFDERGELHRHNGPALIYANGEQQWYKHGLMHRDGAPAIVAPFGYERWYVNGKKHREDGPAVTDTDGSKMWFINGEQMSEEAFNNRNKPRELSVAEIEVLLGFKVKIINKSE